MITRSVVLAAGQGTRMRSALPKVLHPLLGHPLAWHALQAARQATSSQPVLIVGHQAELVQQALGDAAQYVVQEPQLGTGHAVLQARQSLSGQSDFVLVTYADMPLVRPETLSGLIEAHRTFSGPITLMTVLADDPRGFGRIVRDSNGHVNAIIEEAQATPEQLSIRELNTSIYCFTASWLWPALDKIPLSPKGEYYLTDLVAIARQAGLPVQAFRSEDTVVLLGLFCGVVVGVGVCGVRGRINEQWMLASVTMVDPATTYIEPEVSLERDTVIWPNTYIKGKTHLGEACTIGPNTIITDCQVGNNCTILASVLEGSILEDGVQIGPFGHLRNGSHLAQGVHMGNFGEVKNSYLGPGVKMGHFSYLGDATVGAGTNIGAGAITCNYDGEKKHPTEIGEGAFVGSDTLLVAPVKIGEGAHTGAGSVVTKDVPDNTLAAGFPARLIRKLEKSD
ncbi:MAG: bifunctional UDP-N-acetylglucosamine diphosphorylase/glucosamine-1-phosphate N-acetyltransferase GlmU [Omnitrophica WOR_2 bacterium]